MSRLEGAAFWAYQYSLGQCRWSVLLLLILVYTFPVGIKGIVVLKLWTVVLICACAVGASDNRLRGGDFQGLESNRGQQPAELVAQSLAERPRGPSNER